MMPALLSAIGTILYRLTAIATLYLAAPSVVFVFLAWVLLRDCDFTTYLVGNLPWTERVEASAFRQKVCWITDGNCKIGKALAVKLAQRGALVIVSGKNAAALQELSQACERCFLVSEVRACFRSESGINSVIQEASNENNARVLCIPLELSDYDAVKGAIRKGLSWRGRIDVLFNTNGEEGLAALMPAFDATASVLANRCVAQINMTRAVLVTGLSPAPKEQPGIQAQSILRFPEFQRMSTTEFSSMGQDGPYAARSLTRSVGSMVRSFSLGGIDYGYRTITGSAAYSALYRLIWGGFGPKPERVFQVSNLLSLAAKLPWPGCGSYAASDQALAAYSEVAAMDANGFARAGVHSTRVAVTNCYCGHFLMPRLRMMLGLFPAEASPVEAAASPQPEASFLPEDRCAELVLRATAFQLPECWAAKTPYLSFLYCSYYLPWIWRYLSLRFLEEAVFRSVAADTGDLGKRPPPAASPSSSPTAATANLGKTPAVTDHTELAAAAAADDHPNVSSVIEKVAQAADQANTLVERLVNNMERALEQNGG